MTSAPVTASSQLLGVDEMGERVPAAPGCRHPADRAGVVRSDGHVDGPVGGHELTALQPQRHAVVDVPMGAADQRNASRSVGGPARCSRYLVDVRGLVAQTTGPRRRAPIGFGWAARSMPKMPSFTARPSPEVRPSGSDHVGVQMPALPVLHLGPRVGAPQPGPQRAPGGAQLFGQRYGSHADGVPHRRDTSGHNGAGGSPTVASAV